MGNGTALSYQSSDIGVNPNNQVEDLGAYLKQSQASLTQNFPVSLST